MALNADTGGLDGAQRRMPARMVLAVLGALAVLVLVTSVAGLYAVRVIDTAAMHSERLRASAALAQIQELDAVRTPATADAIGRLGDLHGAHFGTAADVGPGQIAEAIPGVAAGADAAARPLLIWTPQRFGSMAFDQTGPVRIVSTSLWVFVIVFILFRLKSTVERLDAARRAARELASRDSLTGLANRMSFEQRLRSELAASLKQDRTLAVLYVDLDGFKQVNDSFGHAAGDMVLKAVADRLRAETRAGDLIARLGGDEFAIVAPTERTPQAAGRFASRLHRALAATYSIGGHTVSAGASIGLALAPEHGRTADELLAHADAALYLAKGRPRARFVVYRPDRAEGPAHPVDPGDIAA